MRPDQVENALYWATRGFKLFPAIWTDKGHKGLVKWSKHSTTDPDIIKQWGEQHPDIAYYCVALQQSGYAVIDIDTKNGKRGLETLKALQGLPRTMAGQTPSGGLHLFFKGDAKPGANRLGPGVDIPVMVPLPGSITGKGEYTIKDLEPIQALPQWVIDHAGKPNETTSAETTILQLDSPSDILKARAYFETADPAIEGAGGDNQTFNVLCYAADNFALSFDKCLELGLLHYNPRCVPPWTDRDFETKVKNAYRYKRSPTGASSPSAEFDIIIKGFKAAADLKVITPEWLIKGIVEMSTVNVAFGDTGTLKSFVEMDRGLHIAMGRPWLGRRSKQGAVIYVAGEGHGGINRRLAAFKKYHEVSDFDWRQVPFYVSDHAVPFLANKSELELLINAVKLLKPVLVIVDTLSAAFAGGDENSVKDMTKFIGKLLQVRDVCGSTVIVVHHTGHGAKERPRGSYSLMAGVDSYWQVESPESMTTVLRSPKKLKDGCPSPDIWFKAHEMQLGVDEDLEDITSLALEYLPDYVEPVAPPKLKKYEKIIMLAFGEKDSMFKDELAEAVAEIQEGKFHKGNFNRGLTSLSAKGVLIVEGETVTILNGLNCVC